MHTTKKVWINFFYRCISTYIYCFRLMRLDILISISKSKTRKKVQEKFIIFLSWEFVFWIPWNIWLWNSSKITMLIPSLTKLHMIRRIIISEFCQVEEKVSIRIFEEFQSHLLHETQNTNSQFTKDYEFFLFWTWR